jgi:hypothetical protein
MSPELIDSLRGCAHYINIGNGLSRCEDCGQVMRGPPDRCFSYCKSTIVNPQLLPKTKEHSTKVIRKHKIQDPRLRAGDALQFFLQKFGITQRRYAIITIPLRLPKIIIKSIRAKRWPPKCVWFSCSCNSRRQFLNRWSTPRWMTKHLLPEANR